MADDMGRSRHFRRSPPILRQATQAALKAGYFDPPNGAGHLCELRSLRHAKDVLSVPLQRPITPEGLLWPELDPGTACRPADGAGAP